MRDRNSQAVTALREHLIASKERVIKEIDATRHQSRLIKILTHDSKRVFNCSSALPGQPDYKNI